MIPILKDGKPIGMLNSNFLIEFLEDTVTTQQFNDIFGDCTATFLDLKLSQTTDDVYVRKAKIMSWHV
jgi:hypothetical protein